MEANAVLNLLLVLLGCLFVEGVSRQQHIRPRVAPIPRVTTLRKQIRNFTPGSRASITIVYQTANKEVKGRWFRSVRSEGSLPFSEINDMLPVAGDHRYDNSSITAGNVVADTLIIKKVLYDMIPAKFTLVLSIDSIPMQYQVDVHIESDTVLQREHLDGVHWTTIPPPTISFGYKGYFEVGCSTILDTESKFFLDELFLYRTYLERHRKRHRSGTMTSVSCGRVHRENKNYLESSGKYTSEGTLTTLKYGYVKYHVMLGVRNATREEQGVYTCSLERKNDRTYVSSWVRQGNLHAKPYVEFLPCEGGKYNKKLEKLDFIKGKETCFRCRGFGYPLPEVSIIDRKFNRPLSPSHDTLVDHHINVPDGGLAEVTYTFLNPSYQHEGQYSCVARNNKGSAEFNFQFDVILSK